MSTFTVTLLVFEALYVLAFAGFDILLLAVTASPRTEDTTRREDRFVRVMCAVAALLWPLTAIFLFCIQLGGPRLLRWLGARLARLVARIRRAPGGTS